MNNSGGVRLPCMAWWSVRLPCIAWCCNRALIAGLLWWRACIDSVQSSRCSGQPLQPYTLLSTMVNHLKSITQDGQNQFTERCFVSIYKTLDYIAIPSYIKSLTYSFKIRICIELDIVLYCSMVALLRLMFWDALPYILVIVKWNMRLVPPH